MAEQQGALDVAIGEYTINNDFSHKLPKGTVQKGHVSLASKILNTKSKVPTRSNTKTEQ